MLLGWLRGKLFFPHVNDQVPFRVDRVLPPDEETWLKRDGWADLEEDEVVQVRESRQMFKIVM